MSNEESIRAVCEFAANLRISGISAVALLTSIKWELIKNNLNEQDIKYYIRKNTNIINDWLLYSENKRTTTGWYFTQREDSSDYIVGFLNTNAKNTNEEKYSDPIDACASFVIKELTGIGNRSSGRE